MGIFTRKGVDPSIDLTHREATWGKPTSCPSCGGAGYLDRVDLVDREMWQHCPACRATWRTSESDCAPARGAQHH